MTNENVQQDGSCSFESEELWFYDYFMLQSLFLQTVFEFLLYLK